MGLSSACCVPLLHMRRSKLPARSSAVSPTCSTKSTSDPATRSYSSRRSARRIRTNHTKSMWVKSGSGVSTNSTEAQGNKSRFQGYYVDTMENGDKGEYSFHGTATMKDAALQTAEDSGTLVHGTGKLKGAKGKGTCKGTGTADGSITWECQGEYTFATK